MSTSLSSSKYLLHKLVDRALASAGELPISEQAELHQAAALALTGVDDPAADVAAHTAMLLRESERQQLIFRDLLKG
jgi:hypothetical protein